MTADLDLSPEAVERLAKRHALHVSSKYPTAATLRALAAELAAASAEVEASAHDIARLKDSETHWLNEADRLRAERDAAWQAGAEAMREAAADEALERWTDEETENRPYHIADAIRALPLPGQPTNNEEPT